MQGLLAQPQQPQQPGGFQQSEQQANIDAQALQKHIMNIVKAAQHIMYSPETRKMFTNRLTQKMKAMPAAAEPAHAA